MFLLVRALLIWVATTLVVTVTTVVEFCANWDKFAHISSHIEGDVIHIKPETYLLRDSKAGQQV